MVLEDLAYRWRGIPPNLRAAIGIESGQSGAVIAELLHRNFSSLPTNVFTPGTAKLLGRNPLFRPIEPLEPLDDRLDPPDEPAGGRGPQLPPRVEDPPATAGPRALEAALRIVNGQWGGWWDGWTG
jgi:hypothetical protein